MTHATHDQWLQHTRFTLERFDEALLRHVAHKLCKPRNQWPVDELLDRVTAALGNVAMLDRRLKDLPVECRRILAVIGRSRLLRWPVGSLVELLVALGAKDGLAPLVTLLESGLLLPELFPFGVNPHEAGLNGRSRVKAFATWLARAEPTPMLLASPLVTRRVSGANLGMECPEAQAPAKAAVHEGDGLDWLLRVAALWQQAFDAPLRRTQQGDFFKRDHDRLKSDALLNAGAVDALAVAPDPGFLAAALATQLGLLRAEASELHVNAWPASWRGDLSSVLGEVWTAFLRVANWNVAQGHAPASGPGHPYPAAYLLALLLLSTLPHDAWAEPRAIEAWIGERHPFWRGKKSATLGIDVFLLAIAYPLRLVHATKGAGGWLVRLSPLGRWLVGDAARPPALASFKQTLLVQPNLEILAYRQGMTPELISSLSRIATWKTLGSACTLQLEPHSVYRALEMGESQTSIEQLLTGYGMKAIPPAVLDSLRTWSSKRERITVYSAGAIFEFASTADMNDAIARGLRAIRLTDRLAIVAGENDIDYKHFRLTGTRDYTLPPERCVDVEADGVTLSVDLARSDLLLETELLRFAEPLPPDAAAAAAARETANRRSYRITPASILQARQHGVSLAYLQTWFGQRTGLPISAAALLLMSGPDTAPVELRRRLVVHVANEHLGDGLAQWPGTRDLILARLGPTALVVDEAAAATLAERLKELGVNVRVDSL